MSSRLHVHPVRSLGVLLILAGARIVAEPTVDLVRDGQPSAVIVVENGVPAMVREVKRTRDEQATVEIKVTVGK